MTAASPWSYLLLAVVGFVASVLNVLSGGGSFLTLPVLNGHGNGGRLRGATLGLLISAR